MTSNELSIAIDGETVIIKGVNDRIFYRIRRKELALKMNDNTSEWIMQLMGKTWIEIDTLYRLAQIIKQEFPNNTIDWRRTFFVVEKRNYLESLGEVMTEKHDSLTEDFFEMIDFARSEANDETHMMIEQILDKRLDEFKL